jgi:DNA integrity scanning protein DisA with diadenylate cyclase activity
MDKMDLLKIKALTQLLRDVNLPKEVIEEAFISTLYTLLNGHENNVIGAISVLEVMSKGEKK